MPECRLGRDEHAAQIDDGHTIHLFQRGVFERLGNGGAGIVHQHIKGAERCDGLFDRGGDGFRIGCIRLDRGRLTTGAFDVAHHLRRRLSTLRVGDGHLGAIGRQPPGDRRSDTARSAGDQSGFP